MQESPATSNGALPLGGVATSSAWHRLRLSLVFCNYDHTEGFGFYVRFGLSILVVAGLLET
jgi:hypothetical protein